MLNSNAKYINNRLALRPPQKESLERFQEIGDILSFSKNPDLDSEFQKIKRLRGSLWVKPQLTTKKLN